MAKWIEAVNRYRPRVTNAPTIDIDFLAERLAVRTLSTRPLADGARGARPRGRQAAAHGAQGALAGYRHALAARAAGRQDAPGDPLRPGLMRSLSTVDAFLGAVEHRESVGLDLAALKVRWDAEHPEDPLELPAKGRVGSPVASGASAAAGVSGCWVSDGDGRGRAFAAPRDRRRAAARAQAPPWAKARSGVGNGGPSEDGPPFAWRGTGCGVADGVEGGAAEPYGSGGGAR
ncbi:MAG: hypothetical protein U0470_11825 [Anaerolineae bacterium]